MKHSFYLKNSQKSSGTNKRSLIYFTCYFKFENKKFVYSTGENIKPSSWNFDDNMPKMKGSNRDSKASTIRTQLERHSNTFERIEAQCQKMNEDFTSNVLREAFDIEFKKVSSRKNIFFDAYDEFMSEKQKRKEWKPATIKRYNNIKTHLTNFEEAKGYKLTFNSINNKFYTEFTEYCYTDLKHFTNTFARNVGLFKTFMFWALKERYTYSENFKEFEKPKKVVTKTEALTLEQVEEIFNYECKSKSHERVKDVFVFQCLTGFRFGELKKINKRSVKNNLIYLKEEKDSSKEYREIPLFEISNYILKKYDYRLPLLSNQRHNEYIKEVLKNAEFNHEVEYTRVRGKEQHQFVKNFYDRISTHTARRTFVTIMRNKGIADKTIMSITGHKDLKTFSMYHKVDNKARFDAVKEVFGKMELPKLKKA